jgi:hypothetical protein
MRFAATWRRGRARFSWAARCAALRVFQGMQRNNLASQLSCLQLVPIPRPVCMQNLLPGISGLSSSTPPCSWCGVSMPAGRTSHASSGTSLSSWSSSCGLLGQVRRVVAASWCRPHAHQGCRPLRRTGPAARLRLLLFLLPRPSRPSSHPVPLWRCPPPSPLTGCPPPLQTAPWMTSSTTQWCNWCSAGCWWHATAPSRGPSPGAQSWSSGRAAWTPCRWPTGPPSLRICGGPWGWAPTLAATSARARPSRCRSQPSAAKLNCCARHRPAHPRLLPACRSKVGTRLHSTCGRASAPRLPCSTSVARLWCSRCWASRSSRSHLTGPGAGRRGRGAEAGLLLLPATTRHALLGPPDACPPATAYCRPCWLLVPSPFSVGWPCCTS